MSVFDLILVWVHLTAATFGVGGMLFLSVVAVPLLKQGVEPAFPQRVFVSLARRFRAWVWVLLFLLVVTGSLLLGRLVDWTASPFTWPTAILVKLILVLGLVLTALLHDQVIGPRIPALKSKDPATLSSAEKRLLWISPLLGRFMMLLGLAVLLAAVRVARM